MQTIQVEDLKKMIDNQEKINLVDVREISEHNEFNIGGILVPLNKIQQFEVNELEPLRNEKIFLYCRSGNRSGQACLYLESMGFTNIINVSGGILAYQELLKNN